MKQTRLLTLMISLLILSAFTLAQTQGAATPARTAAERVVVQKVNVVRGESGLKVEVSASGRLSPAVTAVSNPDRLVLDLPNAFVSEARQIAVGNDGVKVVRVAQNSTNPPVTRVVVDLLEPHAYDVVPHGNQVTLHVRTTAPAGPEAKSIAVPAAAPLSKVSSSEASAPQDFVFVEPKYEAKTESAAVQSSQRAVNAATTMANTTPADELLLPAVSSSMQDSAKAASATPQAPSAQSTTATSPSPTKAVNFAAEQRQLLQAPVGAAKQRYSGEPISVNLKDVDLKDFFRLIHEISGLNIVLDPNVKGNLTIVLDDVPWDQALDIVLKNNKLDRQLEGNVLRIATIETLRKEAEDRRGEVEAQALAVDKVTVTRFLSYAHAKDVMPLAKKLLSSRGDIISDERTNALIVQDIPSVMPEVDRLIAQLDRKTSEVLIEARVVAATRTFARDIGTQLGFGWGNGPSAAGGAPDVGPSPNTSLPNPGSKFFVINGTNSIPLFSNLPVPSPTSGYFFTNTSSNYRVDFILTMAEARGLLKILSRPRVATQNNIQAVVRQGFRIPVVTQAQLGGPPTVTYVDAFLRLTVTPQITAENTIFLNVDVENTTPDFSRTVQGNPTLITQQATTQVLVTDGGTVVIGGVIQTQNSLNIQQVPLLGNIPALGNLFRRRTVNTSTQELIFFITPKIMQT